MPVTSMAAAVPVTAVATAVPVPAAVPVTAAAADASSRCLASYRGRRRANLASATLRDHRRRRASLAPRDHRRDPHPGIARRRCRRRTRRRPRARRSKPGGKSRRGPNERWACFPPVVRAACEGPWGPLSGRGGARLRGRRCEHGTPVQQMDNVAGGAQVDVVAIDTFANRGVREAAALPVLAERASAWPFGDCREGER